MVEKKIKAIWSMSWCLWLHLRLSLWLLLGFSLSKWGVHIFWSKGEVFNLIISVATLMSNVLTWCSFFLFKTTKSSSAPSHGLSRNRIFPLHDWQTWGNLDPFLMQDRRNQSRGWKSHPGLLLANTLCKKMIDMSIDVNVLLLVQVMKKQCSWLRKSC